MIPGVRDFPALDLRLWWLALARLIVNAGFAAVMPFLAMHLAVERNLPVLSVGAMWTVVGLAGAATTWLAGQVSDRLGRRRVLIAAMSLRSINLAALGYALQVHAAFPVIVGLSVMNGAMRAFYDPAAMSIVASLCRKEERVAAFSLHRVGGSLGWTIGPLAATLVTGLPFHVLFYAAAPLTLLGALAVATVPGGRTDGGGHAPNKPKVDRWSLLRDAAFVRFLWATLAFFVLQTQMYHMLAVHAARSLHLDRGQVGALFVVNGILVVLVQLPIVRLISRIGTARALVMGSLGYLVAYTGVGLASGFVSLVSCVAIATLCEILAAPAHQARATALAPPDAVSGYAGMAGFVQGIAQTLGPLLGSVLIDVVTPTFGWPLLATAGLVAALGFRKRPA
jgi:MFS family permease